MSDSIYAPPNSPVGDPREEEFSWSIAFVVASAGTGSSYLAGMLLSPLIQRFYARGLADENQLYQLMFSAFGFNLIVVVLNAAGFFFGGRLAAILAPSRPMAHAAAGGGICILIGAIAYLGVIGSPLPVLTQVVGFAIVLPCFLAGARGQGGLPTVTN
ncbi:MAG: hypothetical protein JNM76_06410 [Betaproteobacteria bacterium]|nr:hypothetical protein [Betaproteobacteria bacterium]